MGSHLKEYAVFFKDPLGRIHKKFSVMVNRHKDAEVKGQRFGIIHDMEYSHVARVFEKVSQN
jgi:hypothetical protein